MNNRKIYEKLIREHVNYNFIPNELKKNWVCVSRNGSNPRLQYWINEKNRLVELGELTSNASLANLAKYIHPTKYHVCKVCGIESSIYYVYPTQNTIKWVKKMFTDCIIGPNEDIFTVYEKIQNENKSNIFQKYFGYSIDELKTTCLNDNYEGKKLSPGVMANPPDRLDGFHCYNSNCGCRKQNDKGRSDENMKSYTRDRRAYELFTDGNIWLTNKLMGKLNTIEQTCFLCNKVAKMTGDHIGPISLGFVHDPINMQACCSSCNSSKNNRFSQNDYDKLCLLENNGNKIVSWWAESCYNKFKKESLIVLKEEMNKNAKKFLEIIEWIRKNKTDVIREYIEKNYEIDNNSYRIKDVIIEENGDISFTFDTEISTKKTKEKQINRTKEILSENLKENRKIKITLLDEEIEKLSNITYETFKSIIYELLENRCKI